MKEDTELAQFRSTLLQNAMQLGLVDLFEALQNNNNIRQLFKDRFQDQMKLSGFLQVLARLLGEFDFETEKFCGKIASANLRPLLDVFGGTLAAVMPSKQEKTNDFLK